MGRIKSSSFKGPPTLFDVGKRVLLNFEHLLRLLSREESQSKISAKQIRQEEQRFRLWAGNLGLHQHGHSSLDYRLRDADVVRSYALDLLTGVEEYLVEVFNVVSGTRLPYEQSSKTAAGKKDGDIGHHALGEESASTRGTLQDSSSDDNESSISGSEAPIEELSLRFEGIVERIDSLYSLATKIRNPSTRPVRPTAELYKHCQVDDVAEYMQERIEIETQVARHILLQHLMQFQPVEIKQRLTQDHAENGQLNTEYDTESEDEECSSLSEKSLNNKVAANVSPQEPRLTFADEANWLLKRIGKANARRRQQFVYWKEHALRIADPKFKPSRETAVPVETKPESPAKQLQVTDVDVPGAQSQAHSNPTVATLLDPQAVRLDDTKSVISHSSRVSSVVPGDQTEALSWPNPPSVDSSGNYFVCEYCKLLCPPQYLSQEKWVNHIKHDLQPYQCTYPDCKQPDRLYASRQEWINHEGLVHARVWICVEHPSQEFETQPDYVEHLSKEHANQPERRSQELVAACMQPSNMPHRGCPFCPVEFKSVKEMSSHISHHLERFALLILPKQAELGEESDDDGRGSIQTKDAAVRAAGPKDDDDSRAGDFDMSISFRLSTEDDNANIIEEAPALSQEILNQSLVEPPPSPTKRMTGWLDNIDDEVDGVPDPREIWLPRSPLRLINVTNDDNKENRLENGDTIERGVRYACLTGLLGPGLTVPTTKSNVTERLSILTGFHRSLTIWMAIRACRKLGIPYLWQRDICLVNDDSDENQWFTDNVEGLYEHAEQVWLTRRQIPQEDDKLLKVEAEAYFARKMKGPDDDCNDRSAIQVMESRPKLATIEEEINRLRDEIAENNVKRKQAHLTMAREEEIRYLDQRIEALHNQLEHMVRARRLARSPVIHDSRDDDFRGDPDDDHGRESSGNGGHSIEPDILSSLGQALGIETSKDTPRQTDIDSGAYAAIQAAYKALQDTARDLLVEENRPKDRRSR